MATTVFVPMREIMETPGLFRALSGTAVTWTERLREFLYAKGLEVWEAQVYDMRVYPDAHEPGWLFCNAASPREAHDAFYGFLFAVRERAG